ncbi:phage tail tube protein [Microvirga sp. TS319]|uniref:phage tail tube protein n=1 Tax=Microvirga sp. TS319 TaxID=3241165 RepID=UPI003519EE76
MAQATTLPFSAFKVMLETGTPGTFAAPCGLTSRSISFSKETNDTNSIDCDQEDAPSWVDRDVVSLSASISGEGVMARESLDLWREAFMTTEPVNARIEVAGSAAQGGGYWSGKFHLTSFEPGATRGERASVSIEMQSSGPIVWSDAVTP